MAVDPMQNEPIQDKGTFWKGVSAGFLAGMAVAAALRFTVFEKFLTNFSTVDAKLERDRERDLQLAAERPEAPPSLPAASAPIAFRRAQPDIAAPTAARTGAVASFLRNGGGSAVEVMEGTGERVDHIDLSQPLPQSLQKPLRPYPRNLDLGSAG